MKKFLKTEWKTLVSSTIAGLVVAVSIVRCGSDGTAANLSYRQIERLGRPAINEALVFENALLNAYNAVAPTVDLTSAASTVVASVARTLTGFFGGVCFVNGAILGATPSTGLKPAGIQCPAVGTAVLGTDNKLTAAMITGANTYITTVAEGFLPDVLRIDTSVSSGYNAATCNASGKGAMLCGGRGLTDNVVDITYGYLLAGDATGTAVPQLSNGVSYDGVAAAGDGNTNQGHKAVLGSFPYAPAPY